MEGIVGILQKRKRMAERRGTQLQVGIMGVVLE
jgi:hypothetical protein